MWRRRVRKGFQIGGKGNKNWIGKKKKPNQWLKSWMIHLLPALSYWRWSAVLSLKLVFYAFSNPVLSFPLSLSFPSATSPSSVLITSGVTSHSYSFWYDDITWFRMFPYHTHSLSLSLPRPPSSSHSVPGNSLSHLSLCVSWLIACFVCIFCSWTSEKRKKKRGSKSRRGCNERESSMGEKIVNVQPEFVA